MRNLVEGWRSSSILVKVGVAVGALVIVALLIGGTIGMVNHFKDAAYQKRETEREAERAQLETEKQQLQSEKQKALLDAADANARADTFKQVAESKRGDKAQTVKELERIEAEHAKRKQEAEAAGSSLSDAELRAELCRKLAARGYPPCPR